VTTCEGSFLAGYLHGDAIECRTERLGESGETDQEVYRGGVRFGLRDGEGELLRTYRLASPRATELAAARRSPAAAQSANRAGEPLGLGESTPHVSESYRGSFRNGVFHGRGVLRTVHAAGSALPQQVVFRYSGEFSNGIQHGRGTEERPDGSTFRGEFKNGLASGFGQITWPRVAASASAASSAGGAGAGGWGASESGDYVNGLKHGRHMYDAAPPPPLGVASDYSPAHVTLHVNRYKFGELQSGELQSGELQSDNPEVGGGGSGGKEGAAVPPPPPPPPGLRADTDRGGRSGADRRSESRSEGAPTGATTAGDTGASFFGQFFGSATPVGTSSSSTRRSSGVHRGAAM